MLYILLNRVIRKFHYTIYYIIVYIYNNYINYNTNTMHTYVTVDYKASVGSWMFQDSSNDENLNFQVI